MTPQLVCGESEHEIATFGGTNGACNDFQVLGFKPRDAHMVLALQLDPCPPLKVCK